MSALAAQQRLVQELLDGLVQAQSHKEGVLLRKGTVPWSIFERVDPDSGLPLGKPLWDRCSRAPWSHARDAIARSVAPSSPPSVPSAFSLPGIRVGPGWGGADRRIIRAVALRARAQARSRALDPWQQPAGVQPGMGHRSVPPHRMGLQPKVAARDAAAADQALVARHDWLATERTLRQEKRRRLQDQADTEKCLQERSLEAAHAAGLQDTGMEFLAGPEAMWRGPGPDRVAWVKCVPPASHIAHRALSCQGRQHDSTGACLRKALKRGWDDIHKPFLAQAAPPLPAGARAETAKPCRYAGRCVCQPCDRLLVAGVRAFVAWLRAAVQKGAPTRALYDAGLLIAKVIPVAGGVAAGVQPGREAARLHISS